MSSLPQSIDFVCLTVSCVLGPNVFRSDHIAGPETVGHAARRRNIHREITEGRTASAGMAGGCRSADADRRARRRPNDGAYRDDASAAKA